MTLINKTKKVIEGRINMEQKLNYLRKYIMRSNGYVRLIPDNEIEKLDSLPNAWYEIFNVKQSKERVNLLLKIWKKHAAIELRNTISY